MLRRSLQRPHHEVLLELLLVLLLVSRVAAVCPTLCSCSRGHREVDCAWRGLRVLPPDLQHNLRSLNLSHNRFHHLDHQLTPYTHLRVLDLSHNRLARLPAGLPRSLWHLRAASNRIRALAKNDTAYQWNLRTLDVSDNRLERATFINNTLINLGALNMSHNHFWTLPTNMPAHLETVDLSNNLLVQVLPGSLDRLHKLTHFYLHANRFSALPAGVLDRLASLHLITLGDNPWTCHGGEDKTYLVKWTRETRARVLGCPCNSHPVCGGSRTAWHFASHDLPPVAATGWWRLSEPTPSDLPPGSPVPHQTVNHFSGPAGAPHSISEPASPGTALTALPALAETSSIIDGSFITETPVGVTDESFTTQTTKKKSTTTLRTRSVRRKNPGSFSGGGLSLGACLTLNLLSLILVL